MKDMSVDIGEIPSEHASNVERFRGLFQGEVPKDAGIDAVVDGNESEIQGRSSGL